MLKKLILNLNNSSLNSLHKAEVIRIHNKLFDNINLPSFKNELINDTHLTENEISEVMKILREII